jgi:nudix-type nucleoside diphosphatase (YffH/AdpP family)
MGAKCDPDPSAPAENTVESAAMSIADRIRIRGTRVLSDAHYRLTETTLDWRRSDGEWQTQKREVFDRGNGAVVLPYDLARGKVVLIRQFRLPAYLNGHEDLLVEAIAGLLDDAHPEDRIRLEAEEESGYRIGELTHVFDAFMSPGSVTETLHFFVAPYDPSMRIGPGGGHPGEGEDIEVLELPIGEALAMVDDGRICDAKTIMLLQYAALKLFPM